MRKGTDAGILWHTRFAALARWKSNHGSCNVPKAEGVLGRWVVRQRELFKKGTLAVERKNLLNNLAFVWNTNHAAWQSKYHLLKQYNDARGHCCVPMSDPQLGMWVAKMRGNKRRGKLCQERVRRLDEIGFIWNTAETEWLEKFERLLQFRKRMGHACVPFNEGELGWWVNTQRQCKRKGKLSLHRERLLNQAHFVWNPHQFHAQRRKLATNKRLADKQVTKACSANEQPPDRQYSLSMATALTNKRQKLQSPQSDSLPSIRTTTPFSTNSTLPMYSRSAQVRSIASLLSPLPDGDKAFIPRMTIFPTQASFLPSLRNEPNLVSTSELPGQRASDFVLPPISSLMQLSGCLYLV